MSLSKSGYLQCQNSADSLAENTPKCLDRFQPKMSAQSQKFGILKKTSIWVSIVRGIYRFYMPKGYDGHGQGGHLLTTWPTSAPSTTKDVLLHPVLHAWRSWRPWSRWPPPCHPTRCCPQAPRTFSCAPPRFTRLEDMAAMVTVATSLPPDPLLPPGTKEVSTGSLVPSNARLHDWPGQALVY